ncbi:SDR family NAD(P)-dependent oxidoreductase [Nocardioides terrisoli]|uniref:SDR family NAD(P)-dependent oxidoreductase n=1 Tax=Nocardioides terrisoli TaxID=3388267 RepID=UPI00287B6182|nr:SDR family NAD(P)-dependent oxidoreductase [Nocardioides marmorisolisilvae]
MTVRLRGARVLLTGATGGIGHALARMLHASGADLVLTGRRTDVLKPLAAEVGAAAIACDLADPDQVERLLAEAGEVDVLVANAALPASGRFEEMTADTVARMLDVNLRAPVMLTHALLPGMLGRRRGQVVLIGSLSGLVASPGSTLYNTAKFGLRGFATSLRQDLHGTGVGISIVEPGFVSEAGMFVNSGMQLPRGTRFVTPEQVAAAVRRAIARDRAEVLAAPFELRLGARIGAVAPALSATIQRRAGAADIVAQHRG